MTTTPAATSTGSAARTTGYRFLALTLTGLFIIAVLYSLRTWRMASQTPWSAVGSDQTIIGLVYYGLYHPEYVVRDWIFSDRSQLAFYTPWITRYLSLAEAAGADVARAFGILELPLLVMYFGAAAALFRYLTRSWLLTVIFALASLVGPRIILGFWNLIHFPLLLPASMAVPFFVLSTGLMIWLLHQSSTRYWQWAALGLITGLCASVHPGSGIGFVMVIAAWQGVLWLRTGFPRWSHVMVSFAGIVIGAAPIVVNVLGGTGTGAVSGAQVSTFSEFATYFARRVSLYPSRSFQTGPLLTWDEPTQLIVGFLWLPLSLGALWLTRPNRRAPAGLLLALIQVVYLHLMTFDLEPLFTLIPAGFLVMQWWQRQERDAMRDWYFLVCLIAVMFVLPAVLWPVWITLQIRELPIMTQEFLRTDALVTLALYLLWARPAVWLMEKPLQRAQVWILWLALLVGIQQLFTLNNVALWMAALTGVIGGYAQNWRTTRPIFYAGWLTLFIATTLRVLVNTTWMIATNETLSTPTVFGIAAVAALMTLFWERAVPALSPHWRMAGITALVAAVTLLVLGLTGNNGTAFGPALIAWVTSAGPGMVILVGSVCVAAVLMRQKQPIILRDHHRLQAAVIVFLFAFVINQLWQELRQPLPTSAVQPPPLYAAAQWLRDNTPQDALIYCSTSAYLSRECFRVRLWAQRSITSDERSLRILLYTRRSEMDYWYQQVEDSYRLLTDEARLYEQVARTGADYLVLETASSLQPEQFILVYQNDGYRIYRTR